MATAKAGGTMKRSSSNRTSQKSPEPDVSPARWAGVALVIAAIMGAIVLAVISPSQPDTVTEPAVVAGAPSPSARPTSLELLIPVAKPVITIPLDGKVTREIEIAMTVDIPEDDTIRRGLLTLYIYHGDKIEDKKPKPKPGTTVTVEGVRLTAGDNILTAALRGPDGYGPVSDPIVVTLDENAPKLDITSPKNKYETYEDQVAVEFTSEVDAKVHIVNEANTFDQDEVMGASGEASIVIPLKRGNNRIEATSIDEAGQDRTVVLRVIRLDGRPRVKVKVPGSVKVGDTPRIAVDVKDSDDKPMKDAEVHFSLSAPNRTTVTEIGTTNASGRAVWNPEITGSSSSAEALDLVVVVTSPSGDKKTLDRKIDL
jgi:hypothetical protein